MKFLIGFILLLMTALPGFAQNYTLQAGDVVTIEVLEDSSLNRSAMVLPDGTITFPFAGSVRAAGRTVSQVQSSLRQALAPNFATQPTVFVSVNQLKNPNASGSSIDIYIVGQVNAPGIYQVESGISFLQALTQTGGFTPFAATKRIQLRRTDPATGRESIFLFNLKAAGDGKQISGNTQLRDGDVILVPERHLFE
ncbi:MAG: polysaccharide export protein [Rhodobacteraceae bacterium]|nr:polysaccharide export protein [Paracoccaceae bacterium]